MMAPSSQDQEPPAIPGRFTDDIQAFLSCVLTARDGGFINFSRAGLFLNEVANECSKVNDLASLFTILKCGQSFASADEDYKRATNITLVIPPKIRGVWKWNFLGIFRRGDSNEEEQIYGSADYVCAETG
jgi:hypothetical protein